MWSYAMPEKEFEANPAGIVRPTIDAMRPGSILLAHDVGDPRRLVTIDHLAAIVAGVRARGLELVTVSQLLSAQTTHS
jgi:hypothetical protein